MSIPPNLVTIHPYFKVHPGQREAFRAGLSAFCEKTKTEPGMVFYEFTSNGDEFFCREGYAGAEAALAHLGNVDQLLKASLQIADLTRLEFHGPAEELDKMRAPLAPLSPQWFVRED